MNIITNNNNSVTVDRNKVYIKGKELPPHPNQGNTNNVTIVNNKVYIDGYEYKNGKWKKTFLAWWYKMF